MTTGSSTWRNCARRAAKLIPNARLVEIESPIGHLGGTGALEATRRISERIVGVVLVDIFHNPEEKYSASAVEDWIAEWRATWHDPAAVRKLGFAPGTPESLIQRYIQNTPDSVPSFWWEALRNFFRWHSDDLLSALAEIRVPIYAINSDRVPTEVAVFQKYALDFQVGIMPGVGHLGVIWEKIKLFDQLLLQAVTHFSK